MDKLSSIYKTTKTSSSAENMTKDFVTNTLKKLEGFDADTWIKFSDKIPEKTMKDIIAKLTKVIDDDKLSSKRNKKGFKRCL
ncbi:MAG: hypothetical protein L6V95_02200 [Candidatus Melainabacteria bacterium]|nr:MAG: hypothetical protein L6V95_02200 [Candidatus Melainabacteria bacterium]